MADKLNDEQIASELKRFGETIKVPIDRKKRPILIKKLNHYYAKENPPQKKGKSSSRLSKLTNRQAEFSDDSQDESETDNVSRISMGRNRTGNNSYRKDSPRKLRNRGSDNAASTNGSSVRSRTAGKHKRSTQMELYPDEFSDNDTADESIYEIEEQSIGINTTLNYDDDDDDTADEDGYQPAVSSSIGRRKIADGNLSTVSQRNFINNVNNVGYKKNDKSKADGSEHFISKTILLVMGIFFMILAGCYVYVRKDIFLQREAASPQSDLKAFSFWEEEVQYNYTETEVNEHAVPFLTELHKELATLKGKFELGELAEEKVRMSREKLEEKVKMTEEKVRMNREKFEEKVKVEDKDVKRMVILCLKLILSHPQWRIQVFDKYGNEAEITKDVEELESMYGNLPVMTRIRLSLYKVIYGLCLLIICVIVGVLGIFCLRWQNKRKERAQQKVYQMVEKIIEILKDNYELAENKNDPKNYPPYLAVQHIRDQLIPVSKRRQMQPVWEDAVRFIESNESRIRVETQIIQGEEFSVWRWLQAMPNGHKVWQGQAFGETSQGSANSLPYGPTPCLKVRNMFDANMEENEDDWHLDIEESILEKCSDNHGILHIFVDRSSKEGCVYIKCSSCQKAYEAYQALHGWWFDGRLVTVKYLRLEHYHDRFPDSRYRKYPLKPSKKEMPSVSRPYHRSALEMT